MEKTEKKTAVEEAKEKEAKEARKPSAEMIDPATGAKETAKQANVAINKHHDKEAIGGKGRVAAFSDDHLADVKTLDDDVLSDEEVEARLPKMPPPQAPRPFDRNEPVSRGLPGEHAERVGGAPQGGAEASQAFKDVKEGKQVMRNAGEADVAPNRRHA